MNIVRLGPGYFPETARNRPIALGKIYVGVPDLDPTVSANQKTLSVRQEDGTVTAVTQPIYTNAGGVPTYLGSPVTLLVSGDYSLAVLNSSDVQVYYVPSNVDTDTPVSISRVYDGDLVAALADLGAVTQVQLDIDCVCVIPSGTSVTVTDNICLNFINGGSISGVSGGGAETLTINGGMFVGLFQVFSDLTLNGDYYYLNTPTVQNLADLRLCPGNKGQSIKLIGDTAAGDVGVKSYWWDESSTSTDDGDTIIKVTAVTQGRWIRNYYKEAASKNSVINGGFCIWQRGISFTAPTTTAQYTADRWGAFRTANQTGFVVSRSASTPDGFRYSLKTQRDNASATTNAFNLVYSNEIENSIKFQSNIATLSFWAKAGANFSPTSSLITVNVNTGTTGNEANNNQSGWTGYVNLLSETQAITTEYVKYSFTTDTIGSTVQQIGIQLNWTPTGTAGADDSLYISGVQLELGSTATDFEYKDYDVELAACQRYYETNYQVNVYPGTASTFLGSIISEGVSTSQLLGTTYSVQKRAVPTIVIYAYTGNSGKVSALGSNSDTGTAVTASYSNENGFGLVEDSGTGFTAGNYYYYLYTSDAEL